MPLDQYRRKRRFNRTPEPRGNSARSRAGELAYVIQKHQASHLHFDFRLEIGGALASWAVPKGPPLRVGEKRLAVHVEDHPLEYGSFEGVIPKGEYGGGTVMLWDRGVWEPQDADPARALKKGKLTFTLHGERLRGEWTLSRMRNADDGRDNWLLIKRGQDAPPLDDDSSPLTSVASGRTMAQIARGADGAVWRSKPKAKRRSKKASASSEPEAAANAADLPGARKAPMPRRLSPQLCTLVDTVPTGDDWLHEIKIDGYRLLAWKQGGSVRLLTRTGKDWTDRFPPIAEAVAALPADTAIFDGEAAILDDEGRSSFQRLQNAIKAGDFGRLAYCIFDLPYAEGHDLTRAPLVERKALLRTIMDAAPADALRFSGHIRGSGAEVIRNACRMNLEGIVSKRAAARYASVRSRDWVKAKCTRRQEFVVVGWTPPSGSRRHFGSLLLAAHDTKGRLVYCGRVGTGFTAATLRDTKKQLDAHARKTDPCDIGPTRAEARGARWVSPTLVAEVEFTERTSDGRLRHPSFQGLREDKPAATVVIETPTPAKGAHPRPEAAKKERAAQPEPADEPQIQGVHISSADRVMYPDAELTKLDIARYYESVAERILPFLRGRPLSVVRQPGGLGTQRFFQKHPGDALGPPVGSIAVRESSGERAAYIAVDSAAGLVALAQFGVLEIHAWGSTREQLEQPDLITFDLDPGEGASFDQVRDGARRVRAVLEEMGMTPFLKATGGKGLHIVAPIQPELEWDKIKSLCAAIARELARADPDRFVANMSKAKRKGKVFIDYLRNGRGATAIVPYSTRARPGAPVATPLRWDELSRLESADRYTVQNMARRLASLQRDPWAGFEKARVSLKKTANS